MIFVFEWLIFYLAIMFAMCVDNIFWISSSVEYYDFTFLGWLPNGNKMEHEGKYYYSKLEYIFKYRIKSVLTDWRDIIPGIMTSFILALIF